ncbi:uncharacterized protein LOC108137414 [Drosophila elegans]|uniref:uncharacterized protein LOC108137414 n=1 Tax=Drosophila elegans TaxID=30023 RepID=UPI0007E77CE7|nr:uncharacterized protein LOC108137414 [Drosophila elegans]
MINAQREDPCHKRSLNLLDKTLPISVATAPQLRTRRQFSFNGMRYEMRGLPQQVQLTRLRAGGGGGGGSQERLTPGKCNSEAAGGDRSECQKRAWPKRLNLSKAANPNSNYSLQTEVQDKKKKEEDVSKLLKNSRRQKPQPAKELDKELKNSRRQKPQPSKELDMKLKNSRRQKPQPQPPMAMELELEESSQSSPGLNTQQSWLLAQSLLRAYGEGTPSKMDYITLAGLVLGCVASQALFLLCWYFSWLKMRAVKLRRRFLGHANLWEFFDLEDTTRYSVQTKLLLTPLILVGGLLYGVLSMLHLGMQVVRSDVPRTVVVFVQRVANSGLLGTITMGLRGGRSAVPVRR